MGTWSIEKRVTGNWVADGTINRPNADFDDPSTSTQRKKKDINGDFIRVLPPTKFTKDEIRWVFLTLTEAQKNKLESYEQNYDGVRITTHVAGKLFEGRFIKVIPGWPIGISPQEWDVSVVFDPATIP